MLRLYGPYVGHVGKRKKEKKGGGLLGGGAMGPVAPLVAGQPSPLFLVGIVPHGKGREGAPPPWPI